MLWKPDHDQGERASQEIDITTVIQWRRQHPRHTGRDQSEWWARSSVCIRVLIGSVQRHIVAGFAGPALREAAR